MRKFFSLFAALTLCVGLWAAKGSIESISVLLGGKQSYFVGDRYDPSGLWIQVHWESGSVDDVLYSEYPTDFSFSPDLNTELQTSHTKVTITYQGFTCDLSILVSNPTPVPTTYLDENGEEQNIDAWEVKDASEAVTWGTAGETTWFVVNGEDVQLSAGAICAGDVRLILADNAKLTATGDNAAGIAVTGTSSLTIYAQSIGTQMGRLIADATSVYGAAGIGGGNNGSGSNITINGGKVTATGGDGAAGIGGGYRGSGSNITILAGTVTATGGEGAAGIGGGEEGTGSYIIIIGGEVTATGGMSAAGIGGGEWGNAFNIFVATSLQVKADGNNPPTTVITNTGADLASSLAGQQYVVTIEIDIPSIKDAAIAAVNAEIEETDNDNVKAIATDAATAINAATTVAEINALKNLAIANIASAKAAYGEAYAAGETAGDAAGYQRAQDELPTTGDCGPTVIITKGDKTLKLYNVDEVEYKITECTEE